MKEEEQYPDQVNHNQLVSRCPTRVNFELYQAYVPENPEFNQQTISQSDIGKKLIPIFNGNQIDRTENYEGIPDFREKLDDYLEFAQSLMNPEGKPLSAPMHFQVAGFREIKRTVYRGDGLVASGGSCVQEVVTYKALDFLQEQKFDFVKAKFFLLFPTMIIFNRFNSGNQISYSEEEMKDMIENYMEKLKEDRVSLELKWKLQLQDLLSRRVHISQIQSIIDQGIQLKYEIPEEVRISVQQTIQNSKSLHKILRNQEKMTFMQLKQYLNQCEEKFQIQTNELIQLRELVQKTEVVIEKIRQFQIPWVDDEDDDEDYSVQKLKRVLGDEKVQFKALKNIVSEIKQLPICNKYFENFHKKIFDQAKDLIEKLSRMNKTTQSKTRSSIQQNQINNGDRQEKMTLTAAKEMANQVRECLITSDEFSTFLELYDEAMMIHERCQMQLEDCRRDPVNSMKSIQQLLKEANECQIQLDVRDRLQDLLDYMNAYERIKKSLLNGKVQETWNDIQLAKERGLFSQELLDLENIISAVLEWNQKCDQLLIPVDEIQIEDIYQNKINIVSFTISDLLPPPKEISDYLSSTKIQQLYELQIKSQEWSYETFKLLNNQNPQRITTLWEKVHNGVMFYRHERDILNQAINKFNEILSWCSIIQQILQHFKQSTQEGMEIENDEYYSLIDDISITVLQKIFKISQLDQSEIRTLETIQQLSKYSNSYTKNSKELRSLKEIIVKVNQWNEQAQGIINSQITINIQQDSTSTVHQYESVIQSLILEAKHLPVNNQLFTQLNGMQEANKKATQIINTLAQKEESFNEIIQFYNQIQDIFIQLTKIIDQTEIPQSQRKKSQLQDIPQQTQSQKAKVYYTCNQKQLMQLLEMIVNHVDINKLKKQQQNSHKLTKLKEMNQEFMFHCQNCPSMLLEDFQQVRNSLAQIIQKYDIWLSMVSNVTSENNFTNKSRKRKQRKHLSSDEIHSEDKSEEGLDENMHFLKGDYLYYYRFPQAITLFVEAISFSFYCNETIDLYRYLEQLYCEIQIAESIINGKNIQTFKEIQLFTQKNQLTYTPQFHVIRKLLTLSSFWVGNATYIINQTPRTKNLLLKKKLDCFIQNFLQTEELQDQERQESSQKKSNSEHSMEQVQTLKKDIKYKKAIQKQSNSLKDDQINLKQFMSLKPKREKKVPKLMQDESMTFYDPNSSLKKAFGPHQQQQQRVIRSYIPQPSPTLLMEGFKSNTRELYELYNEGKQYCICQQGGESQISDWNILKCMAEDRYQEFFYLHLKQQDQQKFMVYCDICEEWYHQECVGTKANQLKQNDKYVCRVCVLKQNPVELISRWRNLYEFIEKDQSQNQEANLFLVEHYKNLAHLDDQLMLTGDIFYNKLKKTSFATFTQFVELGRKIPLNLLELEAIEILYDIFQKWHEQAVILIQNFSLSRETCSNAYIKLVAESLWFPVEFRETEQLLQIVHQIEFVKRAQEILLGKRSILGKSKVIKKSQVERTIHLFEFLHKEGLQQYLDDNDNFLVRIASTLRVQQECNQKLQNEIQVLIQRSSNLVDYQELIERFERQLRPLQNPIPFEVRKLNQIKEQVNNVSKLGHQVMQLIQAINSKSNDSLKLRQFNDESENES